MLSITIYSSRGPLVMTAHTDVEDALKAYITAVAAYKAAVNAVPTKMLCGKYGCDAATLAAVTSTQATRDAAMVTLLAALAEGTIDLVPTP